MSMLRAGNRRSSAHQRVIGYFAVADDVLAARHLIGEYGCKQIFGRHACMRCDFMAAAKAQQREHHRRSNASACRTWARPAAPVSATAARSLQTIARHVFKRKLWLLESDNTIISSVAAACSSKSNLRQKRLRSARPHARLIRLPNGACTISCMPPDSSKNRSRATDANGWQAAQRGLCRRKVIDDLLSRCQRDADFIGSQAIAASRPPMSSRSAIVSRNLDNDCENSSVRAGASPSQNGIVGGCPFASSTRTVPRSTRMIRYDVLPSWNTSPARTPPQNLRSRCRRPATAVPAPCNRPYQESFRLMTADSAAPRRRRAAAIDRIAMQMRSALRCV